MLHSILMHANPYGPAKSEWMLLQGGFLVFLPQDEASNTDPAAEEVASLLAADLGHLLALSDSAFHSAAAKDASLLACIDSYLQHCRCFLVLPDLMCLPTSFCLPLFCFVDVGMFITTPSHSMPVLEGLPDLEWRQ